MKIFYTALVLVCFLTANTIEAQLPREKFPSRENEYQVYVSVGMSNLGYSQANGGETKGGPGFGVGLDYICNVSSMLGFSMGAELSSYHGKALYRSLTETYDAIDDRGKMMEYAYSINNYTEKQNMMFLSVPVMVRFTISAGGRSSFYLAGGMKFGFPVMAEAKISGENITATGYYQYEDLTYSNLPEHGFFSELNINDKKSSIRGFTTMTTFAVETGMRFNPGSRLLYTGVYFDYCINSQNNSGSKHPLNYSGAITYESVLNSSLSSKSNPTSIGIKVRFDIF